MPGPPHHHHPKSGVEVKNRKKRAEELLGIIGGLGPAIIKAGQALSSRPDLLPKEYLDELQKLQVNWNWAMAMAMKDRVTSLLPRARMSS